MRKGSLGVENGKENMGKKSESGGERRKAEKKERKQRRERGERVRKAEAREKERKLSLKNEEVGQKKNGLIIVLGSITN